MPNKTPSGFGVPESCLVFSSVALLLLIIASPTAACCTIAAVALYRLLKGVGGAAANNSALHALPVGGPVLYAFCISPAVTFLSVAMLVLAMGGVTGMVAKHGRAPSN